MDGEEGRNLGLTVSPQTARYLPDRACDDDVIIFSYYLLSAY